MLTLSDLTSAASGGGIHGDGRAANGSLSGVPGESVYDDGKCGVTAEIFANRTGDATMDPIGGKVNPKNCATTAVRSLTVNFGAPLGGPAIGSLTGGHFTNVREVLELTANGQTGLRRYRLMLRGSPAACEHIQYGEMDANGDGYPITVVIDGTAFTSKPIRVTRVSSSPDTWVAVSEGANADGSGAHVALCQIGGVHIGAYDIPFSVEVVKK
jgi:hypothetical protein